MMHYINDNDLINDFHFKSGHSNGSIKSYQTVFNKYAQFHNMGNIGDNVLSNFLSKMVELGFLESTGHKH